MNAGNSDKRKQPENGHNEWILHHDNGPSHMPMATAAILGGKENCTHAAATVFTRLCTL